ncbi:serine/threonine protein kinase [Nonomuraea deserti]|uniref:non-specific serine/threonine protein kinase n=1 Tax=Nonomuraea deserti TaxID=1848322 RepID=A0A4R4W905_9ACTN|nr:serine/threonine-protein kinase [Nonomuraea deserti]TDD12254.1 serine/threonine protein kinase [Nonomuraea deserti]
MSVTPYQGWLLAGRYRLLAELGRGGMGTVWRGHDEVLDRQVAVKEISLPHRPGPEREALLGRTMREARLSARLSHPNIAVVYDVVEADERPWIVLQYVPSRSLDDLVRERGPLPATTVARVGLDLLDALRAAHAKGIVHRDVKPANVLMTDDGHAVLTDFGLATTLDDQAHLTREGIVLGTPAFIAPERARGGPSTPQADLWSLGATLYEAVEGRSPFGDSGALATLSAVLTSSPAPLRQAGPLAPVITGLLDKDPGRRIGTAEAHQELLRVAEQPAHHKAAPSRAEPASLVPADGVLFPIPALGGRPRAGAPGRWRQAAALTALIVAVLATTSWPDGEVAGPRHERSRAESVTYPAPQPSGAMHAYRVSADRPPESDPSRTARPPESDPSRTARPLDDPSRTAQPPDDPSQAARPRSTGGGRPERLPPGLAKQGGKAKRATYANPGKGWGRGRR